MKKIIVLIACGLLAVTTYILADTSLETSPFLLNSRVSSLLFYISLGAFFSILAAHVLIRCLLDADMLDDSPMSPGGLLVKIAGAVILASAACVSFIAVAVFIWGTDQVLVTSLLSTFSNVLAQNNPLLTVLGTLFGCLVIICLGLYEFSHTVKNSETVSVIDQVT